MVKCKNCGVKVDCNCPKDVYTKQEYMEYRCRNCFHWVYELEGGLFHFASNDYGKECGCGCTKPEKSVNINIPNYFVNKERMTRDEIGKFTCKNGSFTCGLLARLYPSDKKRRCRICRRGIEAVDLG